MNPNTIDTIPAPDTAVSQPLQPQPTPSKAMAVISFVFGCLAFLNGFFFMGIAFGITAIILGVISLRKKQGGTVLARIGIIAGIIGMASGIIFTVLWSNGTIQNLVSSPVEYKYSTSGARQKALIDSKKDFAKGETARFGYVDVTVNAVSNNYPAGSNLAENEEYVVVNVTLTNTDVDSQRITDDLKLKINGQAYGSLEKLFDNNWDIQPGASITGYIFYIVKKGGKNMFLQYTREDVLNEETSKMERLNWTLEL